MSSPPKIVLITGCSKGSLGDALARAFHAAGHHVIATARNESKMTHLKEVGIETMKLDVCDQDSINAARDEISKRTDGRLDILLNNAGGMYKSPIADMSIADAKALFDLNVWSFIAMTQTFLPLVVKAKGTIVNHTSISSLVPVPFESAYPASKAAMASFTDSLRFEVAPLGVKIVELKTGNVLSNIYTADPVRLPENSIYAAARGPIEEVMNEAPTIKQCIDADVWATQVVKNVTRENPVRRFWMGGNAWLVWFIRRFLPFDAGDYMIKGMFKIPDVTRLLAKGKAE
ncbi:hypothetical protein MBLNU457_g0988t1 [Dothideomycetes sp. NU457]